MSEHQHIRRAVFEMAALAGQQQPHVAALRAIALRMERALTVDEAAHGLGVAAKTVYNLCNAGRLQRTVERGYVTRRSFDEYLDTQLCAGGGSKLDSGEIHGLATSPTGKYSRGSVPVAHQPHKLEVGGSTPSPATNFGQHEGQTVSTPVKSALTSAHGRALPDSYQTETVNNSARGRYLRCAVPGAQPEPSFQTEGK